MEHDVSDRVGALSRELRERGPLDPGLALRLRAEHVAFSFAEGRAENSEWGTYYGSLMSGTNATGEKVEFPSLSDATEGSLDYWTSRARECSHPLLRLRYADLVWDLSRAACGRAPPIEMARIAIDSTISVAESSLCEHETSLVCKLERAYSLARSIRDDVRVQAVVESILLSEDKIGRDVGSGPWGFSFDILIGGRAPITDAQEAKVISDLEARLSRLGIRPDEESVDPFAIKDAVTRLAPYYRRKDRLSEAHRVLRIYGNAFRALSGRASPLTAVGWLRNVYSLYSEYALRSEADEIAHLIRDVSGRVRDEMQSVSTTVEIPNHEIEAWLTQISEGDLEMVTARVALYFLPDPDKVKEEINRLAKKAPLQAIINQSIHGPDGRVVAQIGSVEDDLEGRVVHQIAQGMQFDSLFLRLALDRLISDHSLDPQQLVQLILRGPLFAPERALLMERGLSAYLRRDFVASICVLIPEIEAAVRTLLVDNKGSIYREGRAGGLVVRAFDEMLGDPAVAEILGEREVVYLRTLLTDPRGWNLRNAVCHGFHPPHGFSLGVANRVLHALLLLSLLRKEETPAQPEELASSG